MELVWHARAELFVAVQQRNLRLGRASILSWPGEAGLQQEQGQKRGMSRKFMEFDPLERELQRHTRFLPARMSFLVIGAVRL